MMNIASENPPRAAHSARLAHVVCFVVRYFDKLKDICTQVGLHCAFGKCFCNLTLLSLKLGDIIGQQLPELKEDVETTRLKAAEALAVAADAAPENESPFDDEDTRAFYEDFPVLRASVPACMFGDRAAPAVEKTADVDAAAGAVSAAKADVERLNLEDDAGADGDGGLGAGVPTALDNLLARLSKCVSKVGMCWCITSLRCLRVMLTAFCRIWTTLGASNSAISTTAGPGAALFAPCSTSRAQALNSSLITLESPPFFPKSFRISVLRWCSS
jgi:hypothetical protein